MELTGEQKSAIEQWVRQGMSIGEVQKMLSSELGIAMTYLETRLLLAELKLAVKDKIPPRQPAAREPEGNIEKSGGPPAAAGPEEKGAGGGVSVEIDRVARAGAVASGSVRFGDGTRGTWEIDAMGRLALKTDKPNYSPSAQDIRGFQEAIGEQLRKRGF